jgi:hypothetical protein
MKCETHLEIKHEMYFLAFKKKPVSVQKIFVTNPTISYYKH